MIDGVNSLAGPAESQEKRGFVPTEEGFSAKEKMEKIISNSKVKT
jgi:hypothetical protein